MSYTPKKCSFCARTILLGNGIMFVRNDGATFWYCSSKCKKNSIDLKRDPRKLKWARPKAAPRVSKGEKVVLAPVAKAPTVAPASSSKKGKQ